jgi:diguanylate cyclase (GGDEF)-like protein
LDEFCVVNQSGLEGPTVQALAAALTPSTPSLSDWSFLLVALLLVVGLMGAWRMWIASRQADAARAQRQAKEARTEVVAVPQPAVTDELTGLSTRLHLEDKLTSGALRADAGGRRMAVLYIDLDGFKPVNDSFGYCTGDALLREVGRRLTAQGRSSDTIARLGGDEFLMLLDGDPDASSAVLVAERVRESLRAPFLIMGRDVRLSCSVGIALYPDHGPRARLLARADAAMTAAKHAGGDTYCFFEQRMDHDAEATISLQRDLRSALETGEGLMLHYQPKIDGFSGLITGVEALMRWHHAERGMVSPVVFVPVAERFGLIGMLGQWVLEEASRQISAWLAEGLRMHVAINLSVHQLRQPDLVERVQATLAKHGVAADLITFEITESAAMEDAETTLRIFDQLAGAGVALSIDDFGTGYSSLSYLRRLPATEVKIDRSFVMDLESDVDARVIVKAVIQLSHALGMAVVAEGVETIGQQEILRQLGCDQLQGYLFAKPMRAAALQMWALNDGVAAHHPAFRASMFGMGRVDIPPTMPGPLSSH